MLLRAATERLVKRDDGRDLVVAVRQSGQSGGQQALLRGEHLEIGGRSVLHEQRGSLDGALERGDLLVVILRLGLVGLHLRQGVIDLHAGVEQRLAEGERGRLLFGAGDPQLCAQATVLEEGLRELTELLDGYDDERAGDLFSEPLPKVRSRVNDPLCREWSDGEAKRCDRKLREEYELWAFLVRQPSLHRHSLQAFRIRCWNEPVIGLPPFVTAGFNADFDGDTMAVFLPHPSSGSLEKFSLPNDPGLVGTGAPALASGLDLALGWWNLDEADRDKWLAQAGLDDPTGQRPKKLEDFLPVLLRHIASRSFPERSSLLGRLQHAVCGASTGAATLSPLEFERLSAHLDKLFPCKKEEEEKDADSAIAAFLREHPDLGLARMVASGAKGKVRDVRHMTWAIGEIDKFEEAPKKPYIRGNFWRGLTEDEMFLYSYPSRDSMAQKKLAVAEAGYLSRQFAEGLFELQVQSEDCGTAKGLEVGYSRMEKKERLTLSLDGETFTLPTLGKLEKDLDRVAWGRTLAGEPARSLSEDDLKAILG